MPLTGIVNIIATYQTLIAFVLGICVVAYLGWLARAEYRRQCAQVRQEWQAWRATHDQQHVEQMERTAYVLDYLDRKLDSHWRLQAEIDTQTQKRIADVALSLSTFRGHHDRCMTGIDTRVADVARALGALHATADSIHGLTKDQTRAQFGSRGPVR